VIGFQFFFNDGSSSIYGNPNNGLVSQINSIDLSNSVIIGINLSYGVYINSIQFITKVKNAALTSTSQIFGTISGNQIFINQANYAPNSVGLSFAIDAINGNADIFSVTSFSVNYNYMECPSSSTKQSVTTSSGSCPYYNKISSIFGISTPSSTSFSIPVSNLFQIVIFSCETVIAMQFFFYDGTTTVYGNPNNGFVSRVDTINLYDRRIIGINLTYGTVINSIQFVLLCISSNTIQTTPIFGMTEDTSVSINLSQNGPVNSSSFAITTINGSADNLHVTSFFVNYYYKQCSK
jgi:hypothetical protein